MMKNKKLISAILAAASIAGGVVGAQAETLDSLTARVDKQDIKIVDLQTTVGIRTSLTNGAGDLSAGVNENTKAIKTKADAWETTKSFANVQEQLDTQDNKNKAQDVSIKAHAAAIKANKEAINTKADAWETTKNFANVQEQLDTQNEKNGAQDVSIKAHAAAIKANKEAIKTKADALETTKNFAKVQEQLDTQNEKNGAQDVSIKAHTAAIKANKEAIKANKDAIENEVKARKDADQKLQKQIDKNGIKADTALKVIGNGAMQNGATNLTDGVNQNTRLVEAEAKARDEADKAEAAARKDADQQLQANINNEVTARENAVNALNSRIGQVESDANKGIAKASALAALRPLEYDPDNKFDISAAGGFYKGENAFALGAFYRPNRNVMLSMGTTLTSGDNAYNVGLSFKVGKSGKHTETGLTTADLYAMIGAMQDKMDQQQKKIEELEAKQAK